MPPSVASNTPTSGRKRKSGELSLDEYLETKLDDPVLQDAVKDILDKLLEQPQKILYAQVKIRDDSLLPSAKKETPSEAASDDPTNKPFSDDYKTLDKVPKDFIRMKVPGMTRRGLPCPGLLGKLRARPVRWRGGVARKENGFGRANLFMIGPFGPEEAKYRPDVSRFVCAIPPPVAPGARFAHQLGAW